MSQKGKTEILESTTRKSAAKSADKKTSMKKKTVRLGAATAMAVGGLAAYNVVAATASMRIIANLIRAIELTVNTTLDFGTLAMTVDRPGQARIDPALNRLFTEGEGSLSLAGGKPQAGRLVLKGAELPIAISIGAPTVKLTNGTNSVVVGDFNLVSSQGGLSMVFTPTANKSSFTIPIGATIRTRTGQVSGTYTGAARIFANYQ